jgi:hypothetical protein
MYSFSFIVIQYSRFAWNPNSLPFFTILAFYGLLRFFREPPGKTKKLWLAAWAAGIAVGSQLHFFGFFNLVAISLLMFFFHYRLWKISEIKNIFSGKTLKNIVITSVLAAIVIGIIYSPYIASDVMEQGKNSKKFILALSAKPVNKPLTEKLKKNVTEQLKYYCLITTAECYKGEAKDFPLSTLLSATIIIAGLAAAGYFLKKNRDENGRDFIYLIFIWFAVFLILCIPLSFQIRPRFFLLVFPLPFISAGFIFKYLEDKIGKYGALASLGIFAIIFLMNARGTLAWFNEQKLSQQQATPINRTLILKAQDGVTLGQLEKVSNYMYQHLKPGSNLYYYVKPEHVMPIKYLLRQKNNPSFNFSPMKINKDPLAQYFAAVPTKSGLAPFIKKYGNNFEVISSAQFGQLSIYEVNILDREIKDNFRFNKPNGKTDRLFWKDVFFSGKRGEDTGISDLE